MVEQAAAVLAQVIVSLDGATAGVHDRIRGRAGSFGAAMRALGLLDAAARSARTRGARPLPFGIDCVVVQSNLPQVDDMCRDVAARFPELGALSFGPAVPAGLASQPGFVEHELLRDEQADRLAGPEETARLAAIAPASVSVSTTDNRFLQMRPDLIADGNVCGRRRRSR